MKRVPALAAAFVAVAALTGTADAARLTGVIVAKDAKRKAVVTASRGTVRTVRVPSKFRRLHVGQRVAVNARALPDGTFAATAARGHGRVTRVRFRGIVVRHDRRAGRLILSAGSSVFAARMQGRSAVSVGGSGLSAGDKVAVTGDVGGGKLTAGLDRSKLPLGTQVKVHCHLLGGVFRLEYMKSETAVVELKL